MIEIELVENCRKENNAARKKLYDVYAPQMLGICLRYTGDRTIAQDLLHDGFIKAFGSFRLFNYRGPGSLKAWLCKIFINICLEYIRKNGNIRNIVSLEEITEPVLIPDEQDCKTIPDEILMQFILELPTGYRTIFNMYMLENRSHKEIGETLGIHESSSRSQLSRAKNILVSKINNYIQQHER